MGGIAGVVRLDGTAAQPRPLGRMFDAMAHRGRDGRNLLQCRETVLGHLAYRSTPEGGVDRPPLRDEAADLAITADVRLDNRDELMAALGISTAGEVSDARLILAAYEKWGSACVERLLGDFAFVIRDGRRGRLLAARDHLGIKPFYHHFQTGRLWLFASEIKGLLASGEIDPSENEARVADFLADVEDDREATFFAGVQRLPPAHTLTLANGVLTIRRYWEPDPERELSLASDAEYGDAFRDVFERAVVARLRSRLPVGVSLSGGLDSCSVACVARQWLAREGAGDLAVHSMTFAGRPDLDERPYVESMIAQGGLRPHWLVCDSLRPLDHLEEVLERFEEPLNSVFLGLAWRFWREVRQSGTRVLLDGVDGDVTVSYAFVYLAELARRGRLATAFREAVGLSRHFWLDTVSPFSIFWREALVPLLPRLGRWRTKPTDQTGSLVAAGLAGRVGLADRLADLRRRRESLRTARQYHCADVTHGVLAYAVEGTNKLTAAAGLEPRHPFFDKRLVEFCIALPREQRVRHGWTRVVMRRALRDFLPEKIRLHGDKFDAAETYARQLTGPDLPAARRLLAENRPLLGEYLDYAALGRIQEQAARAGGFREISGLWRAVALGAWLRLLGEGRFGRKEVTREALTTPA